MKRTKILLVFTAFADLKEIRQDAKRVLWEPLGIAYLKAYLQKESYEVDLLYPLIEQMTKQDVETFLRENGGKYEMVGISSATFQVDVTTDLVDSLREGAFKGLIVLGGLGPSCIWKEFLDSGVDCIIIGEGEKTIAAIADAVEQGRDFHGIKGIAYVDADGEKVRNGYVELIENLDENVFPSREVALKLVKKIKKENMHIQIQSSRGCYGNCSFCSISRFLKEQGGRAWRSRSAANVADEIEGLYRTYGLYKFDFMDENFFPPDKKMALEKAKQLLAEIQRRKLSCEFFIQFQMQILSEELLEVLSACGVKSIFMGVDSFEDAWLVIYNKGYRRQQVLEMLDMIRKSKYSFAPEAEYRVKIGYINFNPLSTIESLRQSGELIKKYGITYKKLITRLRVDDEQAKVYHKIKEQYAEFSQERYFRHEEVKRACSCIFQYYEYVIKDRNELRNLEIFLTQQEDVSGGRAVKQLRQQIDEQLWTFYMNCLNDAEMRNYEEMDRHLLEAVRYYDAYKVTWTKKLYHQREACDVLNYLQLNNMHVKEYD